MGPQASVSPSLTGSFSIRTVYRKIAKVVILEVPSSGDILGSRDPSQEVPPDDLPFVSVFSQSPSHISRPRLSEVLRAMPRSWADEEQLGVN